MALDPRLCRRTVLFSAAALPLMVAGAGSAATPDAASIRDNQVGFVDFVLRTMSSLAAMEWYCGVLRLPLIRGREPEGDLWAGGVKIFELLASNSRLPATRLNDPKSAPTTPMFATRHMRSLLARLERHGVRIVAHEHGPLGEDAFVTDPEGNLIGFRQRAPGLTVAGEPARPAPTLDSFTPGASMMPSDIDGLGWVVRRVVDVDVAAKFYRDVVMLRELPRVAGRARFDMGFGTTLELASGGIAEPVVESRTVVPAAVILRVKDHDLQNAWLKANHVRIVDDALSFDSAKLTYYLDPDGHMIGTDERFEPAQFKKPRRPFPEDLEIERRVKARVQLGDAL